MKLERSILTLVFVLSPLLPMLAGCQTNEIPLAKEKPVLIAPAKPEDLPKSQRPQKGSSAGMNYDPSGIGGPPPK
jgi:hypothetical protein